MKTMNPLLVNTDIQWKRIYTIGAFSALFALAGIIFDIIIGSSLGADLTALPHSAVERFAQFSDNRWLGLYYLDFLNMILQIIMIPAYFALFAAHLKSNLAYASLSLIVFLTGTAIFISGNTALSMFELSQKYGLAATEAEKTLLSAAGEALLAKGAHGSPGVFIEFLLPTIGAFMMSFTMLAGKVFNRITALTGISGNLLMLIYIVIVAFLPAASKNAMIFAMPGGILLMVWMVLFTVRLFKLGNLKT